MDIYDFYKSHFPSIKKKPMCILPQQNRGNKRNTFVARYYLVIERRSIAVRLQAQHLIFAM